MPVQKSSATPRPLPPSYPRPLFRHTRAPFSVIPALAAGISPRCTQAPSPLSHLAPSPPSYPRPLLRHTRARRGYLAALSTKPCPASQTPHAPFPSFLRRQESRRHPSPLRALASRRPAQAPPGVGAGLEHRRAVDSCLRRNDGRGGAELSEIPAASAGMTKLMLAAWQGYWIVRLVVACRDPRCLPSPSRPRRPPLPRRTRERLRHL